jgi:hypothetical protein
MRRLTALGDTKRAFGSRLSACALFNRARLNARGDGGGGLRLKASGPCPQQFPFFLLECRPFRDRGSIKTYELCEKNFIYVF